MFRPLPTFLSVIVLCISAAQAQSVIHVKVDAPVGGNGVSWATAFADLQDAMDAATWGNQIWVAEGVYTPDRGTGNRDTSFQLQSGVAVYGGFVGEELSLDLRDPQLHDTILSGDLQSNDVGDLDNPSHLDNAYHVVTTHDVNSLAVLDGFTIKAGRADGPNFGPSPDSKDQGSGVNNYHGNPTLRNCVVRDNFSANHGAINDHGGASLINCTVSDNRSGNIGGGLYIHHIDMGPTVVVNSTIADNATAGKGGGVYNRGNFRASFTGCTFARNEAGDYGGGVYNVINASSFTDCTFSENRTVNAYGGGLYVAGGDVTVTDSTFVGNSSVEGGGAYIGFHSTTFENCSFIQNEGRDVGHSGGGLYSASNATPILRDCTFRQNTAVGDGGGIYYNTGSQVNLTRCSFVENTARVGGGLYSNATIAGNVLSCSFVANSAFIGGGAYFFGDQQTVVNCLFNGNTATDRGGGVISGRNTADFINCTFYNNSGDIGGGMYTDSFDPSPDVDRVTLTNCIMWGNTDSSGATQRAHIHNAFESLPVVNYSSVQNWDGSLSGVNTIDQDPFFVDADGQDNIAGTEDDNLRLSLVSPGRNAGDDLALPNGVTTDLDGRPRIVGSAVDMGAFELQQGSAVPAVGTWGVTLLALLVLCAGSVVFARRWPGTA